MNFQPNVPDDGELLSQLKQGDRIAFDEIFNRFADPIHTYMRVRLNGSEEADDVLQEVFIRLWNKRQSIEHSHHLSAIIYTLSFSIVSVITFEVHQKKKIYAHRRNARAYRRKAHCPMSSINTNRHITIWKNATYKLPGQMRRIYSMKNEEQLSVKEIASELQLSEQTVKNQLHTAGNVYMKMLRQVQFFFY